MSIHLEFTLRKMVQVDIRRFDAAVGPLRGRSSIPFEKIREIRVVGWSGLLYRFHHAETVFLSAEIDVAS
jgi:hypothetical protein